MRIALCKSHFFGPVSGADEILISYAIRLHTAGQDVHVVLLFKPPETDPHYARLRKAGVPTSYIIRRSLTFMIMRRLRRVVSGLVLLFLLVPHSEIHMRKVWQRVMDLISKSHYRKCVEYFLRHRYDVLHVFTPDVGATQMIRAGCELGLPVLYHEMGTPEYLPALHRYYRQLEEVLPLCTEVAALSPSLATQWAARFPFLRSVSVLPLISEDCELPALPPVLARRKKEVVFGYAARIERGKGPLVLIEALANLRRQGHDAFVRIAGVGPAIGEVKARAREVGLPKDCCEFVGAYHGPLSCSAFMRTLDVFVLPSFAEGTSKSVIEAMAHGIPIITTTVGGLPDLVTPDVGILVPPNDAAALTKAMDRLASWPDLRSRMGKASRQRYLELFAPDAVLPVLTKTYARLTGVDGHGPIGHPWDIQRNCSD